MPRQFAGPVHADALFPALLTTSSLVAGPNLFCKQIFHRLHFQSTVCIHPFELTILFFELFETLNVKRIHATIPTFPLIKSGIGYPKVPTDISYFHAVLLVFKRLHNLALRKS